jgi:pyruvate dehydrogenase (quinone)
LGDGLIAADIIVETLVLARLPCVQVVGDGINPIIEAIRKPQDRIRQVGVRCEEVDVFMESASPSIPAASESASARRAGAIRLLNGLYEADDEAVGRQTVAA